MTTAYHEGVPGHHLQVGAVRCFADRLSRYQRTAAFVSGHGEGWALYAERLMGELGYLENPDYYLGMLSAQAMRCVRVIVDIGMHLELPIPPASASTPARRGRTTSRSSSPSSARSSRASSWRARSSATSAGPRRPSATRSASAPGSPPAKPPSKREGAAFDLKAFHTNALTLGPMGLAQLEKELS